MPRDQKTHLNGDLQTIEVRIADRVRQLRQDKGLTLTRLAQAASMSQAFLSRVENHKVSLTISGLERLARALNTPLSAFFEEDESTTPLVVCRAGQGDKGRLRGARGFLYEMLASGKKGKLMEPVVFDIASAKELMTPTSHAGEEFNYIVEGECKLLYGQREIHLTAGDCVYYDATVPHASHPVKGKPCRLLAVVASRDYLFHGDLKKLLQGEPNGKG